MRRLAPLVAVLLSGSALIGCASADDISKASADKASKAAQANNGGNAQAVPSDLDGGIRQAQLLRQAGQFDEAVHLLSQLMLVASDDPRVVGEYGKTLAEMGRAEDAVQFLTRATELKGNDWSTYSALGVAYDQIGDQTSAKTAYERALALNPSEPSILNNYALSRMLAHDPDTARQLMARARTAGGTADPKIARNIALVDRLAPVPAKTAQPAAPASTAHKTPAPAPAAAPQPAQTANAAPKNLAPAKPATPAAAPVPAANESAKIATPVKTAQAAKPADPKPSDAKPADAKPAAKAETADKGVPALRLAAGGY
jgi:Flp pilus assembly protein TadD